MDEAAQTSARDHMMKGQILTGHVLNAGILAALAAVARESFVPAALKGAAYVDQQIPLGNGRFLMEPLDFARFLRQGAVEAHETVLDIGSGSGYSAAVLSRLARKVVALEEDAGLALQAQALLMGYPNIELARGPLAEGLSRRAPYDVIFIEGAIEILPAALGDQLREGGRLIAAEHDADAKTALSGLGKLVEYRKVRGTLYKTVIRDANVALLEAFRKPAQFAL